MIESAIIAVLIALASAKGATMMRQQGREAA